MEKRKSFKIFIYITYKSLNTTTIFIQAFQSPIRRFIFEKFSKRFQAL